MELDYRGRGAKLDRGSFNADNVQIILDAIRSGAWDYVACEAAGITQDTFYRWMRNGKKNPEGKYGQFFLDVMQARAISRCGAEKEIRAADPLAWLRYGPGKQRRGRPGWGQNDLEAIAPEDTPDPETMPIEQPTTNETLRLVRDAALNALMGKLQSGELKIGTVADVERVAKMVLSLSGTLEGKDGGPEVAEQIRQDLARRLAGISAADSESAIPEQSNSPGAGGAAI